MATITLEVTMLFPQSALRADVSSRGAAEQALARTPVQSAAALPQPMIHVRLTRRRC